MKNIKALLKDQKGQGVTEYALAVLLVVLVVAAVFGTDNPLADVITDMFNRIADLINNMGNNGP